MQFHVVLAHNLYRSRGKSVGSASVKVKRKGIREVIRVSDKNAHTLRTKKKHYFPTAVLCNCLSSYVCNMVDLHSILVSLPPMRTDVSETHGLVPDTETRQMLINDQLRWALYNWVAVATTALPWNNKNVHCGSIYCVWGYLWRHHDVRRLSLATQYRSITDAFFFLF
jgi:hypothetical protein